MTNTIKYKNKNYNIYIDPEDTHLLIERAWNIVYGKGKYYIVSNVYGDGKKSALRLHRLIMGASDGQEVDHINGNGLDNRKVNLRLCNRKENTYNRKPNLGGKYKGVTPHGNKYVAQIQKDKIKFYLGTFVSIKDAAIAYNKKAKELFGNFAYLNIIK